METEQRQSEMMEMFRRGYAAIFQENWPVWLGGLLLGMMSVITFAWARPWGVVGGLRNWGDWFFSGIGLYAQTPPSPLLSTNSLIALGLLWGSFASALLSKQFAIRLAPPFELLKGAVGGILMGIGSAMAGGCNVGGFYNAVGALSMSGIAMMAGLIMGAYLGLRYVYWELEHIPTGSSGGSIEGGGGKRINLLSIEPYLGFLALLAAILFAWRYSNNALTREGVLALCAVSLGLIIQRTRLCFVRAFRDPFMTGEAEVPRAVALSIIVVILGSAALKWTGLREEMVYVPQAFWFGGLVGGIIFGFGMVIAGGCGSGSLWRAGEGQVKLIIAVVFFSLAVSLVEKAIEGSKTLTSLMGHKVFLPYYTGYGWAVVILVGIMLIYYLVATWNEKSERFLVEM
jgi:uncharacterized membrane protein YedE/YeeE